MCIIYSFQGAELIMYISNFLCFIYRMVKSVHERRLERKKVKGDSRQQFEENVEEKDWKEFWKNNSPKLLLYACYHGTVEIVDYFISHHVDPKTT